MTPIAKRLLLLWLALIFAGAPLLADSSSTPPKKKKKLKSLQELITGPTDQPQTVAGVRGLEEDKGEVDTAVRDYPGVARVEGFRLPSGSLERFVEEGNLK